MHALVILGASAFAIALILTPALRSLFLRHGMVDHPDEARKLHARAVPNMGGIPIAIAYAASFAVLMLFGRDYAASAPVALRPALRLLPAVLIIFVSGILDDRFKLQPFQKVLAQLAAGAGAFWAGVRVTGISSHQLPAWLSLVVTLIWLIGCTNAFNLIDGVDGLAAGVGLFATATTLVAALMQDSLPLALATAPLAGALLGFLRYNFNPATIFLGDSGSLLIGFLLGCFGVIWSQKSATLLGMTAPLMALSIPILDVCLSIVRRFLRRQPILRGDRGHIHHRLLARGFTQRRVVLMLYGVCALGAVFSICQSMTENHYAGAVILLFCAATWIGVQHLGYVEFDQARRMILRRGFREALNAELTLRAFEAAFQAEETREGRWEQLKEACRTLGFAEIRWRSHDTDYHEAVWRIAGEAAWEIRIPLGQDGYIVLTRAGGASPLGIDVSLLADVIRRTLAEQVVPQEKSFAQVAR